MPEHFVSFPANESQALALLYVKNLNLNGLTPTQVYDEYRKAYDEICKCRGQHLTSGMKFSK